ncbi:hypothetical protein [Massilia soli]|uniref:Addiction module antitoxin n=1 Tax=Massilia soli TaxID=2792854 RepID=A0ABS7SL20_9BURK|nr:hypothetical protein [Massilia soli]MBZ2206525.1 hypothetical protein [Massilia soli]
MRWITDEDLKTWSRRTDARELFIDLVGDLIRATVADVTKFRFPGQSAGTLRGFDGDLETTVAVSRVPAGHSKWEFGTTPTGKSKAQGDYDKRTLSTSADVMAENAFVMLNLHSWDTPKKTLVAWLAEREAEEKWREVYFIDGTALVQWLEEKPAVAARYAKTVLEKAPRNGALSTDEFWERYSQSFKPALSEKMLLCGREREAEQLLHVLSGGPQNFTLGADSAEEVIAFAIAVIRTAPVELRKMLEARTMVVETYDAAQFLLGMKDMTFLIWKGAEDLGGSLGQKGPTLTAATGQQRNRQGIATLERPTASAMAEAMESMNIDRQEGYDLAFKCGRSLTILRRLRPAAGIAAPAEWEHLAASLKPALLAGGWTTDSELDKEVVASLGGGTDYVAVEAPIRQTLNMCDPPFDKVAQVWQVRAAVDAFPHYGHLVDENDLMRLKVAAIRVLGHQVAQPSAEEKFSFGYRAPADYSTWLRDGLVYTLRLFAVMPEVGGLRLSGTTPQRYVDDVIRSLPGFAQNHQWMLPILSQLSAVAEAAPIPFLEALERTLEGQSSEALGLFQEPSGNDYFFAATSPHVYVLWALEVLAWNPSHLLRVTVVLGRLASIDPGKGSKNGNRPLSSLRRIFIPWSPNTDADLNRRLIAIDGLVRGLPEIAWELMLLLMPRAHDTSSPTARPILRDTKPLESEQITFGLVWDTETRVLDRAIALSQGLELRVVSLVAHLGNLQPPNRARLVAVFEENLSLHSNPEGSVLWHRLREFVAHHEGFPDSDWSLKGEEIVFLKKLLDQHRPSDSVAQARHLFDDWMPLVGTNEKTSMEDVEAARAMELRRVYDELGIQGLFRLANTVKLPGQMGRAFEALDLAFDDADKLIFDLMAAGGECYNLACMISGVLRRDGGVAWVSYFTMFIAPRCKSTKDTVWLLANWPNNAETWAFVQSLGQDVANTYWNEVGSLPWNGPVEEFDEAISELRRAGHSLRVLTSLHKREGQLDSKTLLSLLDEAVAEIVKGGGANTMISYAISEVFETLAGREDVTLLEVARREYIYLPLIEQSVKGLSVHALLAEEPTEYAAILNDVYVSKHEEPDPNPTEEKLTRAKLSYRLLKSFHTIPGDKNGAINEPTLTNWVLEVRRLAAESGREDIADEFIGQLLAHAEPDSVNGAWPPPGVASVLEKIASDIVERGIEIERFNMRGVHSKAPDEGGEQERELASLYRRWAEQTSSSRTTAMLERIAEEWDGNAKRVDIAAEQRKLKR